jgi:hypothetical protein
VKALFVFFEFAPGFLQLGFLGFLFCLQGFNFLFCAFLSGCLDFDGVLSLHEVGLGSVKILLQFIALIFEPFEFLLVGEAAREEEEAEREKGGEFYVFHPFEV